MIDIFFDYFGYDKEHHFVAGIGYEYVIILNLISRIITINRINIIVCRGFVHFMLGDDGFLGENPFGTCLICAGLPSLGSVSGCKKGTPPRDEFYSFCY